MFNFTNNYKIQVKSDTVAPPPPYFTLSGLVYSLGLLIKRPGTSRGV